MARAGVMRRLPVAARERSPGADQPDQSRSHTCHHHRGDQTSMFVHEVNYGSRRRGGAQVSVSADKSPLAAWLEETTKNGGVSGTELAARTGASVDVLKRVRAGHVPLIKTVRRMLARAGTDAATTDRLLTWVTSHRSQRRIRRGNQAQCRECREWEPIFRVRSRRTFRPPHGLQPASFVHRDCADQPGKV